ncbi:MAG: glycosyltransferase family 39 protein [bacterium]|nr:glycosyltransferase family 39 protein [bacterium]
MKYKITAVLIVISALILAVTSVWDDSPIVDEIPHIGAGYSYIAKGDHRLNPEHPPLAKDFAGISLRILGIKGQPAFDSKFWQEDINGQWEFGRKLIFNSDNDVDRLVRYAKLPQLIFFILSGIIIFIWARKLYGNKAALIALFLFSFSPTILAHSRFVTTDMPALFGILLGTYFFLKYLEKPTKNNLWLAGIAFGVAQLTKYSVFLLIPFFIVLAVIYAFLNSPKSKILTTYYFLLSTFFIIAIGFLLVVWPVYYFHTWNYPPERQRADTEYLLGSYGNRLIPDRVIELSDKPVIRGLAEYATGLLMVTQRSIGGNTTYFMGEVRNWAWPQYFPMVYFLKEPLSFWFLLIITFLFLGAKTKFSTFSYQLSKLKDWAKNHFTELAMLLWLAFYWYTSIRSNLNIGVRHLLPVYGFTFILLSGQLVKIGKSITSKKFLTTYCILLATLFGWYLYENLNVYPYYLTYFNQVAGGPSGGYRYVVDSNLDWGQDVKRLAKWVENPPAGGNIQKISLDYFGWADQNYYLKNKLVWITAGKYKNTREFLADNTEGGYIAVSASFYMGSREKIETSYAWLDNYKPVTVIGNSIFVWYISPIK